MSTLALCFCSLIALTTVGFSQNEPAELLALLKKHDEAIRSLEADSGKTKLDQQYLGALRRLAANTADPNQLALINAEMKLVSKPGFLKRPAAGFEKLARFQKVYNASLEPIRNQTSAEIEQLNDRLKALLQKLAEKSAGADRDAVVAVIRSRFDAAAEMPAPPPQPGGDPARKNSLLSFSVLQDQYEPPKPRLIVPVLASFEDLSAAREVQMTSRLAGSEVGSVLPAAAGKLEAPGISRTLLIYTGEGDNRKVAGSLLLRGIEPKRTVGGDAGSPDLLLEIDPAAAQAPAMKDGQLLILRKEKEYPGLFEIKAGPSTISVRGTQVFLLGKNADVSSPRSAGGESAPVLLVKDGKVQVADAGAGNAVAVGEGSERMIRLRTKDALPAAQATKIDALYEEEMRYYPNAKSWLLADFEAADDGTGPLVHWNLPLSEGGNPSKCITSGLETGAKALVLSFPPTVGYHYRYLTFDLKCLADYSDDDRRYDSVQWICFSNGDPSDESALHYELGERHSDFETVCIDLWATDGSWKHRLPKELAAISFCAVGTLFSIDNVALSRFRNPDARQLEVKRMFHDFPPRKSGAAMTSLFWAQRYFDEHYLKVGRAPKHVRFNRVTNEEETEQLAEWFDREVTPGISWADGNSSATGPGYASTLHYQAMRQLMKRSVERGCEELAIDLTPRELLYWASLTGDFGDSGEGWFLDLPMVLESYGADRRFIQEFNEANKNYQPDYRPDSDGFYFDENPGWNIPKERIFVEVFSRMHEKVLEDWARYTIGEDKKVTLYSSLIWDHSWRREDLDDFIQVLRRDPSGEVTRVFPKP